MSSKAQKQAEANIQTFLRIKPSKNPSGYFNQDELEKGSLLFDIPSGFKDDVVNNTKRKHAFHFNGIIEPTATQDEVFKKVGVAAVQNALEGFNSTIFTYGQTGSGKTYTLTGSPDRYSDRGIIPRAISMLYNEYRNRTDIQFKAYISYLEIYNEKGYDLLDQSHESKALEDLPKVSILEDEYGNFHLKNLSMHPADSEEEALNLLFLGDTNRAIAETPMNLASSRSHCIFTLAIECRVVGTDKVRRSKLHLVDLAGSERVAKTNSSGSVLTEAKYINTSLFFLEMVITALYEKSKNQRDFIPYRNSLMTSVLRDSLGGNCKTIMIATINPESAHTEESLSTCKFAQRVSLIKNKALLNEETDPNVIIRRLKDELLNLREEVAFLKGEAGEGEALTPKELDDLKVQCRNYCSDRDPQATLNIGVLTLTKIKDVFAIMKNLVLEGGGGGARGGTAAAGDGGAGSEETERLQRQVKELKSLLLQRDSEIQILVNMVQKGKTAEDVSGAQLRASRGSAGSTSGRLLPGQGLGQGQGQGQGDDESEAGYSGRGGGSDQHSVGPGRGGAGGRSYAEQQRLQQEQRERENQERLIKRHLFGVPPPTDRAIFDDAAASFEWFRERCSLNASMEDNKAVLKAKISEAKLMGERASQSRSTIDYLKKSIEAIRREKVLHRLNTGAKAGDEGEGDGEGGSAAEEESEEEVTHRRAIDQEKVVYKQSCDRLRVLKPEIEHIRKVIEKCHKTMQTQFDQWYQNLHARNGLIGNPAAQAHGSAYPAGTGASLSDTATSVAYGPAGGAGGRAAQSNASLSTSMSTLTTAADGPSAVRQGRGAESKAPSGNGMTAAEYASNMHAADSKGVSDDVNEDILAFYQAKEELLKRRNAGRS